MFINPANDFYVGSTSGFGVRLQHYLKTHSGKLRLILQNIKDIGITNFTLRVYSIPTELQEVRLLLALEQYYILALTPLNNALMVANGSPGGKHLAQQNSLLNSIPLVLSIGEKAIYLFNSMNGTGLGNNAIDGLGTSTNMIAKLLKGELYMNTFTLSRNPPAGMTLAELRDSGQLISFEEMLALVNAAKDQWKYKMRTISPDRIQGPKPTTPAITITRVSDGLTFSFRGYNSARTWILSEVGTNISNDTITKRIESGKPLNGYLYKLTTKS